MPHGARGLLGAWAWAWDAEVGGGSLGEAGGFGLFGPKEGQGRVDAFDLAEPVLCLVPGHVQEPQEPEPPQQIVGVTAAGCWAVVVQSEVPQVGRHRLDRLLVRVEYGVRRVLGLQLNDRADAGQDSPPLHQLVAHVRRHTELLGQSDIAVPNDLKKVQLTHHPCSLRTTTARAAWLSAESAVGQGGTC